MRWNPWWRPRTPCLGSAVVPQLACWVPGTHGHSFLPAQMRVPNWDPETNWASLIQHPGDPEWLGLLDHHRYIQTWSCSPKNSPGVHFFYARVNLKSQVKFPQILTLVILAAVSILSTLGTSKWYQMVSCCQDAAQTAVSKQGDEQPFLGKACLWVDVIDRYR